MPLKNQPTMPLSTEDKVNLVHRMIVDLETKLDQHIKDAENEKYYCPLCCLPITIIKTG